MKPQKMFTYGNNKYRFISEVNLSVGDQVAIAYNSNGQPILKQVAEIVEQRPDGGKWATPKITNTVIVSD